ncbi:MAG: adenylate/guanylate cyclase domain-containing protein [Pseudomonadota bacterium]
MTGLWQGGWTGRLRILSGLVLFAYALLLLVNHAAGLVSIEWMERLHVWRVALLRSLPGTAIMLAALGIHLALALVGLARRRRLRMPVSKALQVLLGLTIPLLLIPYLVETRGVAEVLGVRDGTPYLLWRASEPAGALSHLALVLLVWAHACMGLHFWLRGQSWWQGALPAATAIAALVPAFGLAGFVIAIGKLDPVLSDPNLREAMLAAIGWRADAEGWIDVTARGLTAGFLAALLLALVINVGRRLLAARRTVEVLFVDGARVTGSGGMTVLDIAQNNNVPMVALCGGAGRCTTCRVIVERGADNLAPPNRAEREMLASIGAPEAMRLACQIVPRGPVAVFRVFDIKHGRARAHASTGIERRMVILFLDMRGFTARTSGKPPYDVVYLLNRFFDAIVPSITEHGGRIDKYLGDGILAIFDHPDGSGPACRAALEAMAEIDRALMRFNAQVTADGTEPVRIGIGLHVGALVQGEIGAAGTSQITIIGDTVNTAARLEGMCKPLQAQAVISRPVLEEAGVRLPEAAWQNLNLRGVHLDVQAVPLRSCADILPWLASAEPPQRPLSREAEPARDGTDPPSAEARQPARS